MKRLVMIGSATIFLISCVNNQPSAQAPNPHQPSATVSDDSGNNQPSVPPPPKDGGMYANDLGPKTTDVSGLSAAAQNGYKILLNKCSQCHTAARPLNAQFVEVSSERLAELKKDRPELFTDQNLMRIESDIWRRYVKRMMSKGANVSSGEAKSIYNFLVELYQFRIGEHGEKAEEWRNHRRQLLEEFKKKYPDRYQLLYGSK